MKKNRLPVFMLSFLFIGFCAFLGICSGDVLVAFFTDCFHFILDSFGWLLQLILVMAVILAGFITFSKSGNILIGGPDAKPRYSFRSWFAMALTGGIGTSVVIYAVAEPIIFFTGFYGELDACHIESGSAEASAFAIAHIFHELTFLPYALISVCGVVIAYVNYNQKKPLCILSGLPFLSEKKFSNNIVGYLVDAVSIIGSALMLATNLGAAIMLLSSGLSYCYSIPSGTILFLIVTVALAVFFLTSTISGVARGIKSVANINTYVFFLLMAIILILGPTQYIFQNTTSAIGYWFKNLPLWAFDTGIVTGEPLTKWWTLANTALLLSAVPMLSIFLANVSYGHTVKEYMIINWILPSVFTMVWFGIWGTTSIKWQMDGVVDFAQIISEYGAASAIWAFIQQLPLYQVIIPVVFIALILSFITAANGSISAISSLCVNDQLDAEAPAYIKLIWGISIATISFVLVACTPNSQGFNAIKMMGAPGSVCIMVICILMLVSAYRIFIKNRDCFI